MLSRNNALGKIGMLRGVDKWGGVIARPATKLTQGAWAFCAFFRQRSFRIDELSIVVAASPALPRAAACTPILIGLSHCMNSSILKKPGTNVLPSVSSERISPWEDAISSNDTKVDCSITRAVSSRIRRPRRRRRPQMHQRALAETIRLEHSAGSKGF